MQSCLVLCRTPELPGEGLEICGVSTSSRSNGSFAYAPRMLLPGWNMLTSKYTTCAALLHSVYQPHLCHLHAAVYPCARAQKPCQGRQNTPGLSLG